MPATGKFQLGLFAIIVGSLAAGLFLFANLRVKVRSSSKVIYESSLFIAECGFPFTCWWAPVVKSKGSNDPTIIQADWRIAIWDGEEYKFVQTWEDEPAKFEYAPLLSNVVICVGFSLCCAFLADALLRYVCPGVPSQPSEPESEKTKDEDF